MNDVESGGACFLVLFIGQKCLIPYKFSSESVIKKNIKQKYWRKQKDNGNGIVPDLPTK